MKILHSGIRTSNNQILEHSFVVDEVVGPEQENYVKNITKLAYEFGTIRSSIHMA